MLSITDTAVRQEKIYRRWAPVYDVLYARLLRAAHRAIAASSSDAGRDILEIGVGTGLVLPHYAAHCKIDGIDVSAEMITKAREKVTRKDIRQVRSLKIMDAHELGFPDHSFDAVTLPFVLTLLADPELALNECARVLRPGGQIVIASRLSSGLGSGQDRKSNRAAGALSRPEFSISDFHDHRLGELPLRHRGRRDPFICSRWLFQVDPSEEGRISR